MKNIPYGKQTIKDSDIKAVVRVLKSPYITQGPAIKHFESELCRYTGAKYAVAVSSGTAALHLSVMALDLKSCSYIATSPITFAASANCAVYTGHKPLFCDIDINTYHMDLDKFENSLKGPEGKKIKAVIPVHFMGTVMDMGRLSKICRKHNIKIIEDAAHALGAEYKTGKNNSWIKVGSSTHSDATVLSFHPIKHITTGEGGAILTNSRKIYEKAIRLRHHGIIRTGKSGWRYDIPELGFNYRITDIQCALGASQLKRLDSMVVKRRKLVKSYNEAFRSVKDIVLPYENDLSKGSYHLYVIRVPGAERNALYMFLRKKGILTQVNYIPAYRFSYYKNTHKFNKRDFAETEKYFASCLSLPLYPELKGFQKRRVIKAIKAFFKAG